MPSTTSGTSTTSGGGKTSGTSTTSGGKTSSSSSGKTSSSSSSSSKTSSTTSGGGDPGAKKKLNYDYNDYVQNNAYALSNCPTVGTANVLIIPIWFTDSTSYIKSSKKATVRSDIEKAYLGTNDSTGWRSVKSYYEELSQGKLSLTGTVADWYEPGDPSSTYHTDGDATTKLVEEATNNYFSTSGESRKSYDKNGDGYLDAVLLIYAAPDYGTAGTDNDNMWAYCYWLQNTGNKNVSNPGPNVFFWASYDFMYDSSSAATQTGYSYGAGDTSNCNIDAHTYIHEMGHVLGLEDYYDYSGSYKPAGGFSMQDYNVGSHDPFSAMAYGYVDPYVPTETTTIDLKPFQGNNEVILLSTHNGSVDSPFDEYILIELYTPTGLNKFDTDNQYCGRYPQGPTSAGIRVWHVDARMTYYVSKTDSWSTTLTTNPTKGNVYLAMSNTYYSSKAKDYCSVLGSGYYDYNILQLIRNNKSATYKPTDTLSSSSLFKAGDTFTMSGYASQFVNSGKMNNNTTLGWSFTVNSCSASGASITVTKG